MLLHNKRIFCVEDNTQNRIIFRILLTENGATVDFERWGQDAMFRLKSLPGVDLIILDLMLAHGVSGFDLYDQIRAMPAYARVPIVAVSAVDPAVALPQVRERGFQGFIAKPIDKDLFPAQIAALINGQPVWHTGEALRG